jgi:hypothetical protein
LERSQLLKRQSPARQRAEGEVERSVGRHCTDGHRYFVELPDDSRVTEKRELTMFTGASAVNDPASSPAVSSH